MRTDGVSHARSSLENGNRNGTVIGDDGSAPPGRREVVGDIVVSVAARVLARGTAGMGTKVEPCIGVDEHARRLRMTVPDGIVQRGHAVVGPLRIDIDGGLPGRYGDSRSSFIFGDPSVTPLLRLLGGAWPSA